jgi:mannose-6-phosphate isomerase-like protein (cupin superfamily)
VLVRLASAFNLTLAGLLDPPTDTDERVSRALGQPEWTDPASGYKRRQIFQRGDHPVELIEVEMPAGGRVALPAASYHRIRQLLWVLEGQMVIEEASVRHELEEGDCLGFGPPADTVFANESSAPCRYVVALARQ